MFIKTFSNFINLKKWPHASGLMLQVSSVGEACSL